MKVVEKIKKTSYVQLLLSENRAVACCFSAATTVSRTLLSVTFVRA